MGSIEIPIVFIHMGPAPPPYMRVAVQQARRWNPAAPIICLTSVVEDYGVGEESIPLSKIPMTESHERFTKTTRLPGVGYSNGFWQWTTERLFILEDWMRWKGVKECFHLENDNMLYQDISVLGPLLREVSPGLSTTFQGQGSKRDSIRACFSVLYCHSIDALSQFLFYLAGSPSNVDDMRRGGIFWDDNPEICSFLPTAPVGVKLDSETYRHWIEDSRFSEVGCVFDSTTHGQYLGGADPNYTDLGPGFINPDCDFRSDQFDYTWLVDIENRRYPAVRDSDGRLWKLANLHIHCKRLSDFS